MTRAFALAATALACLCLGCGSSDPVGSDEGSSLSSSAHGLDASEVPADLRHLVPLASRWGIGDDVERMEYIERSSAGDRDALAAAVAPHQAAITSWLDSFGSGAMSDEAAAFMYMQLALEEAP